MSKIDVGVGDEFPLDESRPEEGRHAWKAERRARHWRHHHGHHHHGHRHHRRHGVGRLAFLLVVAGIVALIVEHQLTRNVALGMIGAGVGLMALMFVFHALWHWRHHRRGAGQVS
ncbi:MAG TPA: hypothetical protein VN175_07070 [Rhizomicrobium sp.]|nr:hypothetical protein [Rhizomicrobium sp.]